MVLPYPPSTSNRRSLNFAQAVFMFRLNEQEVGLSPWVAFDYCISYSKAYRMYKELLVVDR